MIAVAILLVINRMERTGIIVTWNDLGHLFGIAVCIHDSEYLYAHALGFGDANIFFPYVYHKHRSGQFGHLTHAHEILFEAG